MFIVDCLDVVCWGNHFHFRGHARSVTSRVGSNRVRVSVIRVKLDVKLVGTRGGRMCFVCVCVCVCVVEVCFSQEHCLTVVTLSVSLFD